MYSFRAERSEISCADNNFKPLTSVRLAATPESDGCRPLAPCAVTHLLQRHVQIVSLEVVLIAWLQTDTVVSRMNDRRQKMAGRRGKTGRGNLPPAWCSDPYCVKMGDCGGRWGQ
ncbi:hypothetical protein BaRGS_00035182 [Batillaria attramentaria]|uniref:Uncharacterized protein n=1 Tax=Batillaria attramentaria TaxID=370345 RepID=A0ABD0JFQ1_9CAEN